jgi:2-C-methyl-D-erythritol 4-phosphate cytidylyltransferase
VVRIERVCVVLSPGDKHWARHDWSGLAKLEAVFAGGEHRAQTVANGLRHLASRLAKDDWVLVHDAARPCVRSELVEQLLDEVGDDPVGGLLAMPLSDTLKSADDNLRVAATLPRQQLWRAQTPQVFRHELLARGLERKPDATDESQAVEAVGYSAPRLIQGQSTNIKVTFAEDLHLAEMILKRQGRIAG